MQYSIIQKSQLENAKRIDAEFYQPEYLEMLNKIKHFKFDNAGKFCDVLRGNTPKEYNEDYEIPVIRSGDLSYEFVNDDENLLRTKDENVFYLKNKDILISSIGFGSIGKINVFNGNNKKFGTVSEVSVLRNCKISPYFLWAFLASKFGQFQINREITGATGQLHLNTGNIKNIIIPILESEKIEGLESIYEEAEEKYKNSKNFYHQAENLLLEELGLKDYDTEEILSTVVNLSEIKNARRMDAEYFQEEYKKVEKAIKKNNYKKLNEVIQNIPAKFDASKQSSKNFKYVELSNINSSVGIVDGFSEVSGREAPGRAKRILTAGDVIASSVEGSLEKVALVYKEQEGYLASTGFFQFRSKEILPEVILVLAKSIVFQMQLEKQCAGTILTAVPKEAVKNIIVPILPKPTQQKIAELVQKSHTSRKKAKELLEEAKRKVEEMIENN